MPNQINPRRIKLRGLVLEGNVPVMVALTDTDDCFILGDSTWATIDWKHSELVTKARTSTFRDKILRVTPESFDLSEFMGGSAENLAKLMRLIHAESSNGDYKSAHREILQSAIPVAAAGGEPAPARPQAAAASRALNQAATWIGKAQDHFGLEDDGTLVGALEALQVPQNEWPNYSQKLAAATSDDEGQAPR